MFVITRGLGDHLVMPDTDALYSHQVTNSSGNDGMVDDLTILRNNLPHIHILVYCTARWRASCASVMTIRKLWWQAIVVGARSFLGNNAV
jgi:hypothetical protein